VIQNVAGNSNGVTRPTEIEAIDAANAKLSREFKEFLVRHDFGGFSPVQMVDLIEKHGEAAAMMVILVNKNYAIYETYGKSHPEFNPRLPYRRPKR